MAEKDILEKILMSYADVFADCINVLVYGGKTRLTAENMCPAPTESFYRGVEKVHNQFCDTGYFCVDKNEIRAHFTAKAEIGKGDYYV